MKTVFGRLLTTTCLVLLLALVLLGTSFRALVRSYLVDTTTGQLLNDAETISELASVYAAEGSLTNSGFLVNLSVASQVSGADAVICNAAGQVVMCSDSPLGCDHQGMTVNADFLESVFSSGTSCGTGVIGGIYDEERYLVAVPITEQTEGINIGIVIVSIPSSATVRVLQRITEIFLFLSLIVVSVAGILMYFLARQQSTPLRQLAEAARRFGHGELDARVHLDENHTVEVQELALAFNNMASSLQKSEYQRQEFVANVSHELKTPMTTIGGYVDGILDGTIPPEKQRYYMHIVSDETRRLSRLVRSMLDISRLQDQGGIPEDKKNRFDLVECAGQALITFEQKINEKQLEVQADFPEHPVYTMAGQDAITQVIYNLLDNAVKFCTPGGLLELRLREAGNKVYVSVANQGETIPPEELPLVFDRFHKTDKSRSKNRDGWGLGLYIVKTIICGHAENISVTSRDGRTEFVFTLPVVG